ncbi:major facilitator superfamily transporter [Gemella morbillorum M424]|uniref:MFS transporter n=1 Tax=Gemella morbillorum TaxID=29391 RepID=A0AAP9HBV0_9BACL|nr:MFS transporter [Gemella morbillorum]EFV35187.1 major facilitator superfamily transporter [Gemella morbillorum M424]QGS08481.1 MFS transporter [Gemella morbillorum]
MVKTKILFSLIMIVFILILVYYLSKKFELKKEQIIIFWILVLFWTAISIIRAYRKLYVITPIEQGGLSLTPVLAAQIAAGYGLMSLIVRLPMFLASDIFKRRKVFIQIALFLLILTSFLVAFNANYLTLYLSSLSLGISATMLALFNVIFSETFSKDKAAVSVSILSIAPLLAEFMAAPIQYILTMDTYKQFNYMWLVSGVIALITFVLTFMMKDYRPVDSDFSFNKVKVVLKHKSFIYICLLAVLLSFIKFSTSGANMIAYGKTDLNMTPLMLAYIDAVFAVPQLIAGVLVGVYLTRKWGIQKTLLFLLGCLLTFYIIALYVNNPYIIYFSYTLNGLGYGGAYNILIALAMQYFDREYRNVSMGIYQAFFALGIYYGDYVYVWIAKHIKHGLFGFSQSKAIFLIVIGITLISMIMVKLKVKDR